MSKKTGSLAFIFVTVLVDVIGVGIIIPILPELIESLGGGSTSDLARIGGYLFIAFSGMQFFFAPVLGELSDRFGRRPVLLLALLGLGIDYILHALAPTLAVLFIGRFLAGITGASFSVANSYIADISTPQNKAKNFGLIGAAFGLGFIIGPGVGGYVGEHFGVRAPFYIAAGLTLLNFIFGLTILPESLAKENRRPINFRKMLPFVSFTHLGKYKGLLLLILAFFLAGISGQVMPSTWTFFTIEVFDWSPSEIGLSLVTVGVLVGFVQAVLLGRIVKAFGTKKTILSGFLFWTFGMILFSFADQDWKLYLFILPYILGGIASPTLQGLISNQVSPKEQGNLQGALTSFVSIGAIVGPLLFTQLFENFTKSDAPIYYPSIAFTAAGVLMLTGCILAFLALRKMTGNEVHPEREAVLDSEDEGAVEKSLAH